jgi:hypothetical protein
MMTISFLGIRIGVRVHRRRRFTRPAMPALSFAPPKVKGVASEASLPLTFSLIPIINTGEGLAFPLLENRSPVLYSYGLDNEFNGLYIGCEAKEIGSCIVSPSGRECPITRGSLVGDVPKAPISQSLLIRKLLCNPT